MSLLSLIFLQQHFAIAIQIRSKNLFRQTNCSNIIIGIVEGGCGGDPKALLFVYKFIYFLSIILHHLCVN